MTFVLDWLRRSSASSTEVVDDVDTNLLHVACVLHSPTYRAVYFPEDDEDVLRAWRDALNRFVYRRVDASDAVLSVRVYMLISGLVYA